MNNTFNLRTVDTVHNSHALTIHPHALVRESTTGYRLPRADAYARRIAEEAEAWLHHARERSRMKDDTLVRKALSSVAFTLRHRAHNLAVPSKLSGTSEHQPALWRLVRSGVGLGAALDVEELRDGRRVRLVVSHEGDRLGEVQRKHVPWLAPLVPFGARLHLVRVTGREGDFTLGCNVAVGHAGKAVAALHHALGHGVGGDGYGNHRDAQAPVEPAPEVQRVPPAPGGDGARTDGATTHARLGSSGLFVAKPRVNRPAADQEDVALYREIDGTARATVRHVPRSGGQG